MTRDAAAARTVWKRLEPIHAVTYFAPEPIGALAAAGYRGFWMSYFAGRAAPLGPVGADVVTALFYNFAPSRVAKALPDAWGYAGPEVALRARMDGSVAALRRAFGDLADDLSVPVELAGRAARAAPVEGRALFAANAALPWPDDPVAVLWQAATLLREHRGDGHVSALMAEGIGGLEAHVLLAIDMGIPGPSFGRIHHLPAALLADLIDGMKDRGLIADEATFTPAGRQAKDRVEELTDDLAIAPYKVLEPAELDELIAALEPLARKLKAAQD